MNNGKTIRSLAALAPLLLTSACGSSADDTDELNVGQVSERLICGWERQLGPEGEVSLVPKVYYPPQMQEQLQRQPELRRAFGSDAITNCDEALEFSRLHLELLDKGEIALEEQPEYDLELARSTMAEMEPPSSLTLPPWPETGADSDDDVTVDTAEAAGDLVDKMQSSAGSLTSYRSLMLLLETDSAGNPLSDSAWCTATPVGRRWNGGHWWTDLIFSAHCVTGTSSTRSGWQYSSGDKWVRYTTHVKVYYNGNQDGSYVDGGIRYAVLGRHSQYNGIFDVSHDIGFATLYSINYGNFQRLNTGSVDINDHFRLRGGGVNENNALTGFYVSGPWSPEEVGGAYMREAGESDLLPCSADSGGPVKLVDGSGGVVATHSMIYGSLLNVGGVSFCATAATNKYMTRVDYWVDWFESVRGGVACARSGSTAQCW